MSDPKWLELARKEIGTKEWPGGSTNPVVAQYYAEAEGHKQPDAVPWCAAFAGAMIKRAGYKPWGNLMARGALPWGTKLSRPIPGAIVVFPRGRPPSGHVAIVEQANASGYTVIGGNQSDAVNRKWHSYKDPVLGFRWPPGAPLPVSLKALKGVPVMVDKTPQQIVDEAQKLYLSVPSIGSLSSARAAASKCAELIFYLAKLQVPTGHPAMKKALKLKVAKRRVAKRRVARKKAK